jgi:hypothetical protein
MQAIDNESSQSAPGFVLRYGNVETLPCPAGVKPKKNLGNAFIVSNGKLFSESFAVMNLQGELITGFVLKEANLGQVKCLGAQGILLPQGNAWGICDFKGHTFTGNSFDDIVDLQNAFLAVGKRNAQTRQTLYALSDIFGNPKTAFEYLKIGAFSDGFAVAQGQHKADVFNTSGTLEFSVACDALRPFCSGYAVFKKNGLWGAVDRTGKVVVQPRFAWLRDCEYKRFCYCDIADSKNTDNMGVVDANDTIVLDTNRGLKDLTILSENTILHRVMYVREEVSGNQRTVYRIPVTGFITGNKITEAKYLFVGEEREGLMAFASYTQASPPPMIGKGRFVVGYMDADFRTVVSIIDYNTKSAFDFGALQACADGKYLSPFIDGTAVVQVRQGEVRAFRGSTFICSQPYVVDKQGRRVNDPVTIQQRMLLHTQASQTAADSPAGGQTEKLLRAKGLSALQLFLRSKCEQVLENLWLVKDSEEERFVLSRLESKTDAGWGGYSCGLLGVKAANKLCGFVDENCAFVVEPVYKQVGHFVDNAAWALRDKQWFILKRACEVLSGFNDDSYGTGSAPWNRLSNAGYEGQNA